MLLCIFVGVSGQVQLDSNGDRIGNYWLWSIAKGRAVYDKWAEVRMTDKEAGKEVQIAHSRKTQTLSTIINSAYISIVLLFLLSGVT